MILTDKDLIEGIEDGSIVYEFGRPDLIGTNSIDVTLGRFIYYLPKNTVIDPQAPPSLDQYAKIDLLQFPEGFITDPAVGYLGETAEKIGSDVYMPQMEGKSSLGRLFLTCHECAGLGDVGFTGHWTLEICSTYPTRLRIGMKIGQVVFHKTTSTPEKDYTKRGRYTGSDGIEASKGI